MPANPSRPAVQPPPGLLPALLLVLLLVLHAAPVLAACPAAGERPAGAGWNGWGNGPAQARYQPGPTLSRAALPRLRLLWAAGFDGTGKVDAQPTVVDGVVYTSGGTTRIHAFDARTGCPLWVSAAGARVRTAISVADTRAGRLLVFGDQAGNARAVHARDGRPAWQRRLDAHPFTLVTAAPLVHDGVAYFGASSGYEEAASQSPGYACCTFRGSLSALDAASGALLWKTHTIDQEPERTGVNERGTDRFGPSGAGIWAAPSLDPVSGILYAGTGNNFSQPATASSDAILAFAASDGHLLWTRQITPADTTNMSCYGDRANCPDRSAPDHDFGAAPVVVRLPGGQVVVLGGQKSGRVTALDGATGALLWQRQLGRGSPLGGIQHGMAAAGETLYVAISDIQIVRKVSQAAAPGAGFQPGLGGAWYLLGARGGGLHALDVRTGELRWSVPHPGCGEVPGCSQAQSAAVTVLDELVLSGGVDGHLRFHDRSDGRILLDLDTRVEVPGTNGVAVRGGALDGPGPVFAEGILFLVSGYQMWGGQPGNALLAYAVAPQ